MMSMGLQRINGDRVELIRGHEIVLAPLTLTFFDSVSFTASACTGVTCMRDAVRKF